MEQEETSPLLSNSTSNSTANISFGNRTDFRHSDRFRRYASSTCILLTVILERIAFYSLAGNLFLFLYQKPFEWLYYNAMNALYVLTGVTYISSFFGGWLADSFIGRYWTIVIALILYAGSYGILTKLAFSQNTNAISHVCFINPYTTQTENQEPCSWLIYLILVIIGIATGTVKANIAPFGADQVRAAGPDSLRVFFNWFYWCINIGSFVAIGAIAYIQSDLGFSIGYVIPASLLGLAIIVFAFGKPLYITQNPSGSAIMAVFAILKEACKSNHRQKSGINNSEITSSTVRSFGPPPSWLDMAKVQYGGKFHEVVVEDVKTLGRVMMVFIALIPYWLLYFQMQTTFLVQGIHMKLSSNSERSCNSTKKQDEGEFSVPAAWLTLFDIVFLLIFIPLMDRIIYPYLDRRGKKIPLLCRISIGMFCAVISMAVAGVLETVRIDYVTKNETICQVIGNNTYDAADIWIFWQIPQYALIGLSEVFASVAGLEYACSQAPRAMQGIIMGLFCFCTGVGSFLGTGLLFAVKDYWLSSGDVNKGHLNYYFFLLAGIQAITFLMFVFFKNKLEVKRPAIAISPQESLHLDQDT